MPQPPKGGDAGLVAYPELGQVPGVQREADGIGTSPQLPVRLSEASRRERNELELEQVG
jgi:hypothetical protein